jgi:putative FmdB family regulatory protein
MATYEYECKKCGLKFERRQAIIEPPLTKCPKCRGKVQRLVSGGANFIIKGGSQDEQREKNCSLETSGKTCCGRDERCGKPPCGEK